MIENVSPKKFLGQHFLTDENISKKIVTALSINEFDKIVEIGPGKGALTKYLFEFSD
ncbi:MAG: 16S rRNA (adenine(1518)-N(6)/adenine(1519)-N(6))-dimethyltransferase, partial [Flavobacteriaceae bacterium]|nr:16S rRNA (adenine(1518)-N(6)/adenine(1519)-N(6))-dimethyltransferase [Flavobacteriaceae bacterium]